MALFRIVYMDILHMRQTTVVKMIMVCEIYKNLVQKMEEDEISRALKKEFIGLLGDDKSYPDIETYDKYRYIAFAITEAGEAAGFCRGFRYAMRLFMECR